VLFFELPAALSLLSLNTLAFLEREHLFVFNPQLASLEFKMIQNLDHRGGLFS
jgi:hypothetical protein